MAEVILFYAFSTLAILSGFMVISSKNPVHSVLFLILVFCNVSGLLILLDLDFFAMIFLIVYVGAIAVLFLFIVMMLNVKISEINENVSRYLPIGGLIGVIFLFEVFLVIDNDFIVSSSNPEFFLKALEFTKTYELSNFDPSLYGQWASLDSRIDTIEALGQVIYTYYFYYFLMAGLVLLVAMIGAIVLTLHKGENVKRQEVFHQNARQFAKTIRKIR